jgi:hypothetical protein
VGWDHGLLGKSRSVDLAWKDKHIPSFDQWRSMLLGGKLVISVEEGGVASQRQTRTVAKQRRLLS